MAVSFHAVIYSTFPVTVFTRTYLRLSQHFPEFAVIPLRFFQNESRARIDWTEGGEVRPYCPERAMVLSWSARSKWPKWSFAARVFRTFGRRRDFNPMVVLFRPFRRARISRFLPAFQEQKHGNSASVEQLRRDLMQALQQMPG